MWREDARRGRELFWMAAMQGSACKARLPFGNMLRVDLRRSGSEEDCVRILSGKTCGRGVDIGLIDYCLHFVVASFFFCFLRGGTC